MEGNVWNLVSIVLGVMTIILCEVGKGIALWMERGKEKDLLDDGIITKKQFWTKLKSDMRVRASSIYVENKTK
jgi:hypothetical protein